MASYPVLSVKVVSRRLQPPYIHQSTSHELLGKKHGHYDGYYGYCGYEMLSININ